MCGIAGFAPSRHATTPCPITATRRMTDYMRLRGPDAEGLWSSDEVVLGHRRLAILDLDSRANQPMHAQGRRHSIIFNGEIYNFRELRQDLEARGKEFRTTSDTEVLLELFARDGAAMLTRLRGMFAMAIWDAVTRELFLARDRYGIKPLYYAANQHGVLFASQVKALLASQLVAADEEPAGVAGFYLWGSVPEPWTLYRDVFALPAGHCMRVRDGLRDEPVCWHNIRAGWRGTGEAADPDELEGRVRQALEDSVRAHLVSDVPVSVFLSGGIDSAAVAGLAAGLGARVEGITLGFEEFDGQPNDEVPAAAAIAAHYGLPHFIKRVSRTEFETDLPRILHAMDQPSVDGINTWFASKAAAERGYKVVLSGVGGDELFRGYSSFREVPRTAAVGRALSALPGASTLLRWPCNYLARKLHRPKLAGVPAFMGSLEGAYFLNRGLFLPEELPALMGIERGRLGLTRLGGSPAGMVPGDARDETAAVGQFESELYLRNQLLRDSDWASMAHSLELRTPLIDGALLDSLGPYVSGFDGGRGKAMVARSPRMALPPFIATRSKTGFSVPMGKWLSQSTDRNDLADLPLLSPSTPWARRWARTVVHRMARCA